MAETKKDYITDLSYLNFNGEVEQAYFNGEAMMMFYNGLKVFNRAEYTLTVYEPLVDAEGIKDLSKTLLLDSFKKNYGEEKEDVPFIVEPNEIPPNETEEQINGKIKVTQSVSNFEIEITYTQREDRIVGYKISDVTVRNPMYMQAAASGGVWIPFSISYFGKRLEVWASGKEGKTESWGGSVNSNQQSYIEQVIGRGMNGGTFDDSNGAVYAPELDTEPTPYQEIAEITYIRFVDIGGNTREWSGHVFAWQEENKKSEYDRKYDISSKFDFNNRTIDGESVTLELQVSAYVVIYYEWSSGADGGSSTENASVFISANVGTINTSAASGYERVTWSIPRNQSGSSRTLTLRVYNSNAGYDVTYKVYQDPYVAPVVWSTPTLNGNVSVVIPASGNRTLFKIPVRQTKTENGQLFPYEWEAMVTQVQGHAVESSNASFSEGYLSCDSLGKRVFENGREAFYAERIWVIGKDGEEHEVELNDYIIIRQAKNVMEEDESRYYITSSMDNDGGTLPASEYGVRVRATAYKWVKYIWSSRADGEECYEPVPLYVKTNVTSDITTISDSVDGSVTEIYVGANTGNTTREIEVTVYNDSSDINYSETYEITQEAHVQIITWSVPQLNGNIAWEVPASGMAIPFFIPVIQYKYIDGVRQEPGISWHAQATYVSGDVLNDSEAVFSEGEISCETRGFNYSNTPREVFSANVIKIEDTNGSEVELKLLSSLIIKQSMNIYETRYGERHLSFTNPTNESWVDSAGATVIVQVACYQESYREYSSLAREPLASVSGIANISSNPIQSELPSTLNDGVETRFWMPENITSTTKSVQLTATYGSLSDSVTIYQYAASYALSITSLSSINVSAQVGDSGKLIEFKGISTRNGRPFVGSDEVSVSVEGSTQIVYSIGELVFDSETGEFTIPVTIYNNTSVSSRSLTMIVTQSNSDYTERLTITQDAMVATDNIKWGDAYYYYGLQNTMTARLLFKSNVSVIGFYYKINGVVQGDFQNLQLVPQGTQGEWKYMDITRNKQFDYINSTVQFVAEYNGEVEIVTLEYKGGGDIT